MSRTARVALVLAACILSLCIGGLLPFEVLFYLLAGWVFFLMRVLPEVKVDPGGLAIAGVCLVSIAGLSHSFLGWFARQARGEAWKLRWTASLVAGLVVMFAAGISAAGIAHQVGWLFTSGEPWVGFPGHAAMRAQSVNNIKQIELALANYETTSGAYPAGATVGSRGELLHGWQARLLPFLEQRAAYDQINFAIPWDDPANAVPMRTRVLAFLNPKIRVEVDASGPSPSHYAANACVLGGDSARKLNEIPDGTSKTIHFGEAGAEFKPWGHPTNWRDPALGINRAPGGFGSPFPGGANFAFVDGSVRFIKDSVDPKVLRAIATPDGGESVSAESY